MYALPTGERPLVPVTLAPRIICPLVPGVDEPELLSIMPSEIAELVDAPDDT